MAVIIIGALLEVINKQQKFEVLLKQNDITFPIFPHLKY